VLRGVQSFDVAAGILCDAEGRVLIAERVGGGPFNGMWEFPGGKVEEGESPAAALERELSEELGLSARVRSPLTFAVHEEPGLRVLLLFYDVAAGGSAPRR